MQANVVLALTKALKFRIFNIDSLTEGKENKKAKGDVSTSTGNSGLRVLNFESLFCHPHSKIVKVHFEPAGTSTDKVII